MGLRAVAIAAPYHPVGNPGSLALSSSEPVSLQNAMRLAASRAQSGKGAWGDSNWNGHRLLRAERLLLMDGLDSGLDQFDRLLERESPNLLFIGAMTLGLPGAVAIAERARKHLGDSIAIVLGGRHVSESMFLGPSDEVMHHPGSPLRLMQEGRIPRVFDLVVAGEAEELVADLGDRVGRLPDAAYARAISEAPKELSSRGSWIAGRLSGGQIDGQVGRHPLPRYELPPPSLAFGVRSAFDIFGGRKTAHVFSDSGSGCAMDCAFCSERRSVTGSLQTAGSASRLMTQLETAAHVIVEDTPRFGYSAFVEDSILLGGSRAEWQELIRTAQNRGFEIPFGAQLTVDVIHKHRDLLPELRRIGLEYVFIGIETLTPSAIGGMHKDTQARAMPWSRRVAGALEVLAKAQIDCGAALLFGLGESAYDRINLFNHLFRWRAEFGLPSLLSMNWAVQHPLQGRDGGAGYCYVDWGTPPGDLLQALQNFGEASLRYPLVGVDPPRLDEVLEVVRMGREFRHFRGARQVVGVA